MDDFDDGGGKKTKGGKTKRRRTRRDDEDDDAEADLKADGDEDGGDGEKPKSLHSV